MSCGFWDDGWLRLHGRLASDGWGDGQGCAAAQSLEVLAMATLGPRVLGPECVEGNGLVWPVPHCLWDLRWPPVCVPTPGDGAVGLRAFEFIGHRLYVREFLKEAGISCL